MARASARESITPAILVRYCGVPRRSDAGAVIASAAATARFTVPRRATSRSGSPARSPGKKRRVGDIGEADRAGRDPAALHGQDHRGRGGGVVADLPLQLLVGVAVLAEAGMRIAVTISPGCSAVT